MDTTIILNHLIKKYGNYCAVEDLSFSIERGEVFGLLGPNGAGKTTTLNMITGLVSPTAGDVRVGGIDPYAKPRAVRKMLGFVPQETALYEELSAQENLEYAYALYGGEPSCMTQRIHEMLDLMSLSERAKDRVKTFSGGMKRRLALGRALLHDPEILFLDEPTLGVDVQNCHILWKHIRDLKGHQKTAIVTTNHMTEADMLCDRVAIIDHGRLITLDTPANLKSSIGNDRVSVGIAPGTELLDSLMESLKQIDNTVKVNFQSSTTHPQIEICVPKAAEKIQTILAKISSYHTVLEVEIHTPSLDDVFLQYTGRKLRD